MKKKIMVLGLVLSLAMSTLYATTYAKEEKRLEKKEVVFFSCATEKEEEYLMSMRASLDSWADDLRKSQGIDGKVLFGKPISIRNVPEYACFFVPVFINSKCVSIITLGVDPTGENDGYCMSMNGDFAQVINELPNGTYCFEYDAEIDATCLIGTDTRIIIQTNRFIKQFVNISTEKNEVDRYEDEITVDIYADFLYSSESETEGNRS